MKPVGIPTTAPIISGRNTMTGIIHIGMAVPDEPDTCLPTIAIVVKKTITPTISSSAAIGIRVCVTGPLVLNS